jgi:uncharacterized phage protein (TIGR01671 family)
MRKIKFRAKHIMSGKWVYGWYTEIGDKPTIIEFDRDTVHLVNKKTVGQFTELKDKNGKEIYEGDIVHKSKLHGVWTIEYDDCNARFIAFNQINSDRNLEADTCADKLNFLDDGDISAYVRITEDKGFICKIIGNIYENPNLLKTN